MRTNQYRDFFFPSPLHLWNNLPIEASDSTLLSLSSSLKNITFAFLNITIIEPEKPKIAHSRLRTGCSALNLDIFTEYIYLFITL